MEQENSNTAPVSKQAEPSQPEFTSIETSLQAFNNIFAPDRTTLTKRKYVYTPIYINSSSSSSPGVNHTKKRKTNEQNNSIGDKSVNPLEMCVGYNGQAPPPPEPVANQQRESTDDVVVKIVNSLSYADNNNYLDITENVNVFQFPKKKLYIRDCYKTMFSNICKALTLTKNVIITGQPGIGKSSFLYVLLFYLNNILTKLSKEQDFKQFQQKCYEISQIKLEIEKKISNVNDKIQEFNKLIEQLCSLLDSEENVLNIQNDINELIKVIQEKIINSEIDKEKEENICTILKNIYNKYNEYVNNKLSLEEYNRSKNNIEQEERLLTAKYDRVSKTVGDELQQLDRNFKGMENIRNEITENIIKSEIIQNKIYIFKGKKFGGDSSVRYYSFEKVVGEDGITQLYKLKKIEKPSEIELSLIITDTYSEDFGGNYRVISISSPDYKNNKIYIDGKEARLYFDSFDDKEIREWYSNCIDPLPAGFGEVCKLYGNIPRQVYYHYLYYDNYEKSYWDYYKKLIEAVVGSTGYCRFVEDYMSKENLEKKSLSNLILKYDMELEWNDKVNCNTLTPKDNLKFVSDPVGIYVTSKFLPPTNKSEYEELLEYSELVNDEYIKRMVMKQKVAYKLSTEIIKINEKDDSFNISDDVKYNVYYPSEGKHVIFFILKEGNCFDLISNGIFVKILYGNETFSQDYIKTNEKIIKESIMQYSKKKYGNFKCATIKEEKKSGENNKEGDYTTNLFGVTIKEPSSAASGIINDNAGNEIDIKTASYHLNEIYVYDKDNFYIMRDFYYKVFDLILKGFNDERQRNYLILGTEGIGKNVLSYVLKSLIESNDNLSSNFEVFVINSYTTEDGLNKKSHIKPYIVIANEVVIGEDDFADAKMIILIGNIYDIRYKTFQSKRLPLIMYIPPFSKEEVVGVIYLQNPYVMDNIREAIKSQYEYIDIINNNRKKQTILKPKICTIDINFTNEEAKDRNTVDNNTEKYKIYQNIKKKYEENYSYYGGVIKKFTTDLTKIKKKIIELENKNKLLEMIEEIMRGINVSPLTKCDDNNDLLIYDTDKDDITKSTHLKFLSSEIKDIAFSHLLINDINILEGLLKLVEGNLSGSLAGYVYEKAVFYLIKKSESFRKILWERMCNSKVIFNGLSTLISFFENEDIKSNDDVDKAIGKIKKTNEKNFKLLFMDLSYKCNFPDIDALLGPFTIQTTVGVEHKVSPEIIAIKNQILSKYIGIDIKSIEDEIGFFFISPNEKVDSIMLQNKRIDLYPKSFQNLLDMGGFHDIKKMENVTISIPWNIIKDNIQQLKQVRK